MSAVSRLGDGSDHGGVIISASPDTTCDGIQVARQNDTHSCPIAGHGITPITPITTRTFVNGRLVITVGAVAGCGAIITGGSSTTTAE